MPPIFPFSPSTTVSFLNAFRAQPAAGAVTFPVVRASAEGGSFFDLVPATLTRANGAELRGSVRRLLEETANLEEPTVGEWAVNEFAAPGGFVFAQWVHASGRFVFLADMGDHAEVFAGTAAHGVLCSLANAVAEDGAVTTLFHFAFFDQGVARLRSALRQETSPLFVVALTLADVIDRSGQYDGLSPDQMGLYDLGRRQLHRLSLGKTGIAIETPALLPKKAFARSLELTFGGAPDQSGGVHFPGALSNDGREYLSICLKDESPQARGEPMPLHADLLRDLWDFSMALASGSEMERA